ncbi:hypothetical protein [Pseudoclavibacter sp. RFBB5]|uniref:hypothetical protein n=1 Tax=Pseudoclavibacter sp. RFBB5 TaxID=2080574 RepID=UPI000CE780CD|nr:hypothetical protein [Pseudoclavibacter sp. RFBB5]PPG29635.1 hypothetical protein C5B97_11730 [Pseudoclavibacter sp. RFBB5]
MSELHKFRGKGTPRGGQLRVFPPYIYDDFERPNSADLGSTSYAAVPWVKNGSPATPARILNGMLDFANMTATGVVSLDAGTGNMRVSMRIGAIGATPAARGGGLLFRYGAGGYWWLSFRIDSTTPGLQFWKSEGGTTSAVGASIPLVPQAGDRITVVANGANLKALVNGVQVLEINEGTLAAQTLVGVLGHAQGTGLKVAEFSVASL